MGLQIGQMMSVLQNNKGMTLLEVLIASVITLMLFLALMQTALLSIEMNTRNLIRDEAVRIAEQRMNEARNISFTNLASDTGLLAGDCPAGFFATGVLVERNIRNITGFDFCTNLTCAEIGGDGDCTTNDSDNKQITITIGWIWKGEDYTHDISSIVRNQ